MLSFENFPTLRFVTPEGDSVLHLSQSDGRIIALARQIARQFRKGDRVGLIYRSSPELILAWCASLVAGVEPSILQYPTKRQARAYWKDSISHILETCRIAGLLVGSELQDNEIAHVARCHSLDFSEDASGNLHHLEGAIIQMSSGTTGHRKGIRYSLSEIEVHVHAYDEVMQLSRNDTVVSWLPLYHDMGFIACFLMPLIKGIDVVMIDPMDWVGTPNLLFDAIMRYRGTVCYMPNFGFEVMARVRPTTRPTSMRMWISCSEPVLLGTVKRFMEVTGARPRQMCACYAMAENVFAISQSDGLETIWVDGAERVACGAPIPGVQVKLKDGEIWLKSPTSTKGYLDQGSIIDSDGFYGTGDLGELTDRGLVVRGRSRDILIQAGVKHLLSDVDHVLSEVDPGIKGRCCTLAVPDARQGTERAMVLVERAAFYRRAEESRLAEEVRARTLLADLEVRFVPPNFITKTSSGKVNRPATLRSLLALSDKSAAQKLPLATELDRLLPGLDRSIPIEACLDSLGLLNLQMIFSERHIEVDTKKSVGQLLAEASEPPSVSATDDGIVSIVLCSDGRQFDWLGAEEVATLAEIVGAPVRVEQVTAPAVPALISDIIFRDWFLPSNNSVEYNAFITQIDKIKNASVLVFDDVAEYAHGSGILPVLDHKFRRSEDADLLCYRWQRYTSAHDKLPITAVDLSTQTPIERERAFGALSEYLGKPIFRIAVLGGFRDRTGPWDCRDGQIWPDKRLKRDLNHELVKEAFHAFLRKNSSHLIKIPAISAPDFVRLDPDHFCCFLIDRSKIDDIMDSYGSFNIIGPPQSLPYVQKKAQALGKRIRVVAHCAASPEGVIRVEDAAVDCNLAVGAWGMFASEKPFIQLIASYGATLQDSLNESQHWMRVNFATEHYPFVAQTTTDREGTFFSAKDIALLDEDAETPRALIRSFEADTFVSDFWSDVQPKVIAPRVMQAAPDSNGAAVVETPWGAVLHCPENRWEWAARLELPAYAEGASLNLFIEILAGGIAIAFDDANRVTAARCFRIGTLEHVRLNLSCGKPTRIYFYNIQKASSQAAFRRISLNTRIASLEMLPDVGSLPHLCD